MASRSLWRGALALGGPMTLYIEVHKATDKYAGAEPLRQVCADHMQPFSRRDLCSVTGAKRLTDELLKSGQTEGAERMVMGAEKAPGEYVEVDANTLKAIEESISSDMLEPLALEPRVELPITAIADNWILTNNQKVPGSKAAVDLLCGMLAARDKALIGRWSNRGKQAIVAITAVGDMLHMSRLRYPQETREPEAIMRRESVDERAIELAESVIDLPASFSLAQAEDESVTRKAEAVQAALAGTLAPMPTATPAPSVTQDLMAELESFGAGKEKPAKAAKAKAKVTA